MPREKVGHKPLQIAVPDAHRSALEELAAIGGESLSALVRLGIEQLLNKAAARKGKKYAGVRKALSRNAAVNKVTAQ